MKRPEIELEAVLPDFTLTNPLLQTRMDEGSESLASTKYLIRRGKSEIGFVTLDRFAALSIIVIYEIFVLPSWRRRGICRAVLSAVEYMARAESAHTLRIKPHPLETNISHAELSAFYKSEGFIDSEEPEDDFLEKVVS